MEIKISKFDRNLIADIIHDRFFSVDEIFFDKSNNSLLVPYYSDIDALIPEGRITFFNVRAVRIVDNEKIQIYDFNYIEYIESKNTINIFTGFPLSFEIVIDKFDISVELF